MDVHIGILLKTIHVHSSVIRERTHRTGKEGRDVQIPCFFPWLNVRWSPSMYLRGSVHIYNNTTMEMKEDMNIFLFGSFYCLPMIIFLSCFLNILKMMWSGGSDGKEPACNAGDLGLIPGSGRFPGEGKATHSSILAWRIPWTEKTGRLQSMELQRVGHDWATNTSSFFQRCK